MGKIKWTEKAIIEYINDANNNYTFVDFKEYNGVKSIVMVKCNNKNHGIQEVNFDSLRQGSKCRKCENENRKYSYEYVKSYVEKFNYKLLSNKYEYYTNKRICVQCDKHHKPYFVKFSSFKNENKRCKLCKNDNLKHDYSYVKSFIESKGYELLSDVYVNNIGKLLLRCSENHLFYMSFDRFSKGGRCPHCNMSSGEQEVAKILDKYGIKYEIQYRFDDCRNIRTLPFDFYIVDKNIAIEFDGIYHYKIKAKESICDFIKRKNNDGIKNEYCYKNNIQLIRIPYWEFKNIENIICKKLNIKII